MPVRHASVDALGGSEQLTLLERAAQAEADLAAAAGDVSGRGRIAGFQSVAIRLAMPAIAELARDAPRLRCEFVESEPEDSLPALALGDVDLAIGDEWQHLPWRLPAGVERHELLRESVRLVLPARHPVARRHPDTVPLGEVAAEAFVTSHEGMAWEEMTLRTCRQRGRFDPDIRYRCNDANMALAFVEKGLAVTLLPDLTLIEVGRGLAIRDVVGGPLSRGIQAFTRAADAARPSTQALLAAVRAQASLHAEAA